MKKTANEILSALEIALGNPAETVPAGFRTTRQWAEAWGVSKDSAKSSCQKHLPTGRMTRKHFKILTKNGVRPIAHYKAVK